MQIKGIILSALGVISLFYFYQSLSSSNNHSARCSSESPRGVAGATWLSSQARPGRSRIAKVTMLYGSTNELYERALRTHERHNENFGYPMHVLREQILPGWGPMGYWNKPSYLLSLVLSELAKPEEERSEWLMYAITLHTPNVARIKR